MKDYLLTYSIWMIYKCNGKNQRSLVKKKTCSLPYACMTGALIMKYKRCVITLEFNHILSIPFKQKIKFSLQLILLLLLDFGHIMDWMDLGIWKHGKIIEKGVMQQSKEKRSKIGIWKLVKMNRMKHPSKC